MHTSQRANPGSGPALVGDGPSLLPRSQGAVAGDNPGSGPTPATRSKKGPGPATGGCTRPPGDCLQAWLIVLVAESPCHGYGLLSRLAEVGVGPIEAVAVYRALRALEREGVVASRWDERASGPARRTYQLIGAGAQRLALFAGRLQQAQRGLGAGGQRGQDLAQRLASVAPGAGR